MPALPGLGVTFLSPPGALILGCSRRGQSYLGEDAEEGEYTWRALSAAARTWSDNNLKLPDPGNHLFKGCGLIWMPRIINQSPKEFVPAQSLQILALKTARCIST